MDAKRIGVILMNLFLAAASLTAVATPAQAACTTYDVDDTTLRVTCRDNDSGCSNNQIDILGRGNCQTEEGCDGTAIFVLAQDTCSTCHGNVIDLSVGSPNCKTSGLM